MSQGVPDYSLNNPLIHNLTADLQKLKNPEKSRILGGFFKTERGGYGEGDVFLGVSVPEQRRVSRKYTELSLENLKVLLSSRIHEYRLTSLLVLILKYKKTDAKGKKDIYTFYIQNIRNINNWDLVDLSAATILGDYLFDRDRSILYRLVNSRNLWKRRIAVMTTFFFIKHNRFDETLQIAEMLLDDEHDLIHKAVGWMLREIGKRDQKTEEVFLKKHYKKMPRTMLRYAVEKFDEKKRTFYLMK